MTRPVLLVATRNRGKVREFGELLAGSGMDLRGLADVAGAPRVVEDGATYLENARAKALAAARFAGLPALADDSGLEVDALEGAPGVRSARFAGPAATDTDNVALLLRRLAGVPAARRTARFRCVIVVARADGRTLHAEGTCEGTIAEGARGMDGFGYDPVFYYPPAGRTFAELPASEKNRVSHRARACEVILAQLGPFLG